MRNLLTGLAMTLASAASAQEAEVANNASFGDWVVNCEAVSTQRTSCRVVQTQSRADTNTLVIQLIGYAMAEGGAVIVAQVPMGVYLPAGLSYRAEAAPDTAQQAMIWQRCAGQICEAALQLDADGLAELNDAEQVLFGYLPQPGAEPVIARVNTSTLIAALDATRPE
ncbi:invasion associated locus B family protein [Yoonia sp. R2331]|uniref:invasion associated locus B family protein n=1 Tax=Yoonia sp. R2331 TaxID=3237238 RepID=UPI0034E43BE0